MRQSDELLLTLSSKVEEMKRLVSNGNLNLPILIPVYFSTIELTKVRLSMPLTEIKKFSVEI